MRNHSKPPNSIVPVSLWHCAHAPSYTGKPTCSLQTICHEQLVDVGCAGMKALAALQMFWGGIDWPLNKDTLHLRQLRLRLQALQPEVPAITSLWARAAVRHGDTGTPGCAITEHTGNEAQSSAHCLPFHLGKQVQAIKG